MDTIDNGSFSELIGLCILVMTLLTFAGLIGVKIFLNIKEELDNEDE